jgi:hypothetical protein
MVSMSCPMWDIVFNTMRLHHSRDVSGAQWTILDPSSQNHSAAKTSKVVLGKIVVPL